MTTKKDIFYEKLNEIMKTSTDRSFFISNERYETLLEETKQAQILKKNNQSLSTKQYRRLKRYDVLKIGEAENLIESGCDNTCDSKIRYYCKADELFDVVEKAHISVGHKRTRGKSVDQSSFNVIALVSQLPIKLMIFSVLYYA